VKVNSALHEVGLGFSVSFGVIKKHQSTIFSLIPAPKSLLPSEAYPDHPATVFIVTLPLASGGASQLEDMGEG
jgi:hypothetical protein